MSSSEVNCTDPDVTLPPQVADLCDIVLDLAGISYSRISQGRKIAQALESTLSLMNKEQAKVARKRIQEIETRWGPMLYGASSPVHATAANPQKIAPEKIIAAWLFRRKSPDRFLRVICRAVNFIENDRQRLGDIQEYAFQKEIDHVMMPVNYDQFRQWMLEMRVGCPIREGGKVWYAKGEWWEVWKEVGEELGGEEVSLQSPDTSQTASYASETGPYAAKKAAVGVGAKQKVGEGKTSTTLGRIRYQLAVLKSEQYRRHQKTRKNSARKWTQKRKAVSAKKQ